MYSNRRTFLKQVTLGAGGCLLLPDFASRADAAPSPSLPRSTPEAEGVSSAAIGAFVAAMAEAKHELHSFMLVRHGRVIAEAWWAPYAPELNHTMYSMSKSFTSTAVGLAVVEGRLRVEDRVLSFFPEDAPAEVSEGLAALQVKHLLTMSVGNEKEPTSTVVQAEHWVRAFLAAPITHPPGSVFMYNSVATYMLSAIVQKLTGQRVVEYLQPRLFEPLGIEGATWETCPRGINTGGWGLAIQTEGLAKFGQLYLQKGRWNERQILPAKWVEEATTFKIQQTPPTPAKRPNAENDWVQGYGYQFWRSQHGAYRGDGAFGQYTIVLPEQDAVIAMTGESGNMQGELDLVWKHLLPALQDQPLPPDPDAHAALRQTLSSRALPPPKGHPAPALAERISGKTFHLEGGAFQSASFAFHDRACLFTLADPAGSYPVQCGAESWTLGESSVPGTPPRIISGGAPKPGTKFKIAAGGAWRDDQTYEMTWRYYETPHHDTVACRFEGDTVQITFLSSIAQSRGQTKDPRGTIAA